MMGTINQADMPIVAAWPWPMVADLPVGGLPPAGPAPQWAVVRKPCQLQGAAWSLAQVPVQLQQAEEAAQAGLVVLLGLAYEAAPAFDAALPVWAGLASALPTALSAELSNEFFTEQPPAQAWPLLHWAAWDAQDVQPCTWADIAQPLPSPLPMEPWLDATPSAAYAQHFAQLQAAIAQGEFYQLNLTTRMHSSAQHPVDPWALFCQLWQRQPAAQALFWRTGLGNVLSLSPELFVRWDSPQVLVAPMKGTRKPQQAGAETETAVAQTDLAQTDLAQTALAESAKDRAENVMIVDLLRNDLAKICQPRSVQVRSLFDVMHLPTVQQMSSSIVGRTQPGLGLWGLLQALFPCGSITGAPKVQAMRRIAQWEPGPRGWYCGALGVLSNGGRRVHLNVPIRTLFLQNQAKVGNAAGDGLGSNNMAVHSSYGVGSGCTWYSQADDERREWWLKAELLHAVAPPLQLFETVRLERGQWVAGEDHLARLSRSAQQLGFVCNPQAWRQALLGFAQNNAGQGALGAKGEEHVYRGRWVLSPDGTLHISCGPMPSTPATVALQLAAGPCVARPCWLGHKTTYRPHYEAPLQAAGAGVFDVLLYNTQGLLTETCRANVLLHVQGEWLTPRFDAGHANFLPGVYRAALLRHNGVREAALTLDHLHQAQAMAVVNSLRGAVPVHSLHLGQNFGQNLGPNFGLDFAVDPGLPLKPQARGQTLYFEQVPLPALPALPGL